MKQKTEEIKGVWRREWNSEHPFVFVAIILPMIENFRSSKDIHMCIERNMELWDQGRFAALVDNKFNSIQGEEGDPSRAAPWRHKRSFQSGTITAPYSLE